MKNFTQKFIGLLALVFTINNAFAQIPGLVVNVTCGGGAYEEEVSWEVIDQYGHIVLSGGAPYSGILFYDPNEAYTLNMYDSWGDGWNGNVWAIAEWHVDFWATLPQGSSGSVSFGAPPTACTDSAAFNYNPIATEDDGSCVAVVNGCLNELALNYNPDANTDDGSCIIEGCTDIEAFNYNEEATEDNGSCVAVVNGCMDEFACNYNSDANTDDSSCYSAEQYYDCNDVCLNDSDQDGVCDEIEVVGCTDSEAFNYNDEATDDNGSCVAVVNGCVDSSMSNYNSEANTDDGSCVSWEELANSLQSELDNVVIEDGVSQEDVDAAYADGVASVEVAECEEVATQNMPLDLPQGWSMFGYTCLESLDVVEAFSGVSNNIEIVKDEWGLAYLPAWGFSAFETLEFGEGYQIKMIEEVADFQFCEAIVPEDGIGQDDVDAAYTEGAASVTPEDGIGQADVDAAVAEVEASYAGYTAPLDLQIGDLHAGGIVFQINENGSGLVAAIEDLDGFYEWAQAVSQAPSYSSEGYTNWHLPTLDELELMYNTIGNGGPEGNIGGFEDNSYWSSSEYDIYRASSVLFYNGNSYADPKDFTYRVRVIRTF